MVKQTADRVVKFCDIKTAEKILTTQALRWSAPHLLNDPFEPNANLQLGYSYQDMLKLTVSQTVSMLFGSEIPAGTTPMLHAIRRWRDEERFDCVNEASEVLSGLLQPMVTARQEHLNRQLARWQNYTQNLRICCFSAKVNNPHAWQYFADNHKGVALCFNTGPGTDFSAAKPVVYHDDRPEVFDLDNQVKAIINNEAEDSSNTFSQFFMLKAKTRSQEQEWRCLRTEVPAKANSAGYSDRKFNGADLSAIYFGVGTPVAAKHELLALALTVNSAINAYHGSLCRHSYDVDFTPLPTDSIHTLPGSPMTSLQQTAL